MSSLYRRNGIYWLSFRDHGKAHCISLKTRDRSTAIYLKTQKDQALIQGKEIVPNQKSLCLALLDDYLKYNEHRHAKHYSSNSASRIRAFLAWAHIEAVNQITEGLFQDYLNYRLNSRKIGLYGANNDILSMKAWLNWCVRLKKIFDNPIKGIRKFRPPETTKRALSKPLIAEMLKAAADPELYVDRKPTALPWVATARYAGLRKEELFKLDWTAFDFKRNTLTVSNKDGFTTKSKKNRIIKLCTQLKRILLPLRRSSGRCFDTTNHRRIWGRIARKIGYPDLKIHELRHTFISHALVTDKVDIPTVATWAGHSSWETTKGYTHVVFLEKKKPAK